MIRFAPLRYKVLCADGWRRREGFAIDLPGHPNLRFCCSRVYGIWRIDSYDTGMGLLAVATERSRRAIAASLLAHVPMLLAGGRYTKRCREAARWIRRARALGRQS